MSCNVKYIWLFNYAVRLLTLCVVKAVVWTTELQCAVAVGQVWSGLQSCNSV